MQKKVIIIGGGIIGLSIGYRLIKKNLDVTIIDRNSPGREASWSAAGMLRPQAEFENVHLLELSMESIKLYPGFADELKHDTGIDINYRANGTIIVAVNDEQLKELKERYNAQKKSGLSVKWLSNKELFELEPHVNEKVKGSVLIRGDHWADNRLIVDALAKGLKKYGAKIQEGCNVNGYIEEKNKVIGVETAKRNFFGDIIINAGGSWASLIMSENKKLIPPVKPIRGQLIEIEAQDWLITHNVCTYGSYLACKNKNRVLIGSTMEDVGFDKSITKEGISQLMKNAVEIVPEINDCRLIDKWAGLRPASPDKLPILGRTEAENLLIATGTYRNGILLAPIIGKLISDIIITSKEPDIIKPFKLERFATKDKNG